MYMKKYTYTTQVKAIVFSPTSTVNFMHYSALPGLLITFFITRIYNQQHLKQGVLLSKAFVRTKGSLKANYSTAVP